MWASLLIHKVLSSRSSVRILDINWLICFFFFSSFFFFFFFFFLLLFMVVCYGLLFEGVHSVEFMYQVFTRMWRKTPVPSYLLTRMPGESYRRRVRSLFLWSCDVFPALINSLRLLAEVCLWGVGGWGGGETQRETVARTRKLYLPGERETDRQTDRHRQRDRGSNSKT